MGNVATLVKSLAGADAGQIRPIRSGDNPVNEDASANFERTYHVLGAPVFKAVTGTPNADESYPDLDGDGETFGYVEGTAAAQEGHIAWHGRLAPHQTKIKSLKIGLKGAGNYKLRIYVEAAGPAWTLAYDSTSQATPGSHTVVTRIDTDLSVQPINAKRYVVVIEASVGNAETVFATRPYVEQE